MGDNVGKLFYGLELPTRDSDKNPIDRSTYRMLFNGSDTSRQPDDALIVLEEVYDTKQLFMVIKTTLKYAYNGGDFCSHEIGTDAQWKQRLLDKAQEMVTMIEDLLDKQWIDVRMDER